MHIKMFAKCKLLTSLPEIFANLDIACFLCLAVVRVNLHINPALCGRLGKKTCTTKCETAKCGVSHCYAE